MFAIGDPVRDLLSWVSDKDGFERRCDPNRWTTFKDICWHEFSFDPDEDGIQGAGCAGPAPGPGAKLTQSPGRTRILSFSFLRHK